MQIAAIFDAGVAFIWCAGAPFLTVRKMCTTNCQGSLAGKSLAITIKVLVPPATVLRTVQLPALEARCRRMTSAAIIDWRVPPRFCCSSR
jgi:hypothetical protein